MEPTVITLPDEGPVRTELATLKAEARKIVICDKQSHEAVLGYLKKLGGMRRAVVELFKPTKEAAHKTHKAACEAEKRLLEPIDDERDIYIKDANDYEKEQKRLAEIEQLKLEKIAKDKADADALEAAEAAEEAGDDELAKQIIDEAMDEPPPVVHVETQVAKVAGVSSREVWSAEVTDLVVLLRYVVENTENLGLIEPNMTKLNQLARAMHKELKIPGVRAVSTTTKAVR